MVTGNDCTKIEHHGQGARKGRLAHEGIPLGGSFLFSIICFSWSFEPTHFTQAAYGGHIVRYEIVLTSFHAYCERARCYLDIICTRFV